MFSIECHENASISVLYKRYEKIAQSSLKPVKIGYFGFCLSMKRKLDNFETEKDRVCIIYIHDISVFSIVQPP